VIAAAFGDRLAAERCLTAVASAGRYGRKNRSGFYRYSEDGKKENVDESVYDLMPTGRTRAEFSEEEIRDRLVLAMLNEAARCLEEGVLRNVRDGDVGAVFGIGFPPFRGGPFRYMDSLDVGVVAERLEELNHRFPGRFEPADILTQVARENGRFHAVEERNG
jgi:3-hydroxyacyl-CoA dehydrogenase/enoyl-CoA hydratase/3-hydroxybutyryl-CoA epimerase